MSEAAIQARPSVYRIVNTTNGKQYVGSTFNTKNRRRRHYADLRSGIHHSVYLQRAWAKHGEAAFRFEVVEYVDDTGWLLFIEQSYIDTLKASNLQYNVCMEAGNCAGIKQSEETKKKRADKLRGQTRSPESKKAISDAKKGRSSDRIRAAAKRLGEKNRFKLTRWDAEHLVGMNMAGAPMIGLAAVMKVGNKALYFAIREYFPGFMSFVNGGRPHAK